MRWLDRQPDWVLVALSAACFSVAILSFILFAIVVAAAII